MKSDYHERREARIERLQEQAAKAESEATAYGNRATTLAHAMNGQPILIGHHSEKRHRRDIARMDSYMGKAVALSDKAKHYEQRAAAAESNRAISSDDPEAVEKIKAKIAKLESLQAIYKAGNRLVRSKPKNESTPGKIRALVALGMNEGAALKLFEPDFCGRIGFPDYVLQNNNANIRRLKKRLESMEAEASAETTETAHEGFKIIENVEENRIQIDFENKAAYMRLCKDRGINLRSLGWRYSKTTGCWQRHLNNAGRYAAQEVVRLMQEGTV